MSDFCKNCNHDSSYHIPLPLVNVWLIFDLQKYVNWLCVFLKVKPFFQKAPVFCMDLQPAADPYNVVCKQTLHTIATPYRRSSNTSRILKGVCYYAVIIARCGKLCMQTRWKLVLAALTKTSKFGENINGSVDKGVRKNVGE